MWAETNVDSFHTDRIFGRIRQWYIVVTVTAGVYSLNAAASSPGVGVSGSAGSLVITFEQGSQNFWEMPVAVLTNTDPTFKITSLGAGTATFTVTNPPASGSIHIQFHTGRTG